MKYLKLFESFRSSENSFISVEDVNELIDYNWNPNDNQVWRWYQIKTTTEEAPLSFIYNIDGTERKGKGSYKNLLRTLPSWNKFSNRLKSIIGTTSIDYAKSWSYYNNDIYAIIPVKNEVIVGVNPDVNFKGAFPLFDKIVNKEDFFKIEISDFIEDMRKVSGSKNYPDMGDGIKDIKINKIIKEFTLTESEYERSKKLEVGHDNYNKIKLKLKYQPLLEFISDNNIKKGVELMDSLLDPIANGYRKMKYTDLIKEIPTFDNGSDSNSSWDSTFRGYEVWFECDCILINESVIKEFKGV